MTHDEAIREQAVERYLLGELPEEARDRFEEHYFDCALCIEDLKAAVAFVDGLKATPQPAATPQRGIALVQPQRVATRLQWWLVPALAASLLLIAYQNILVLPGMRRTVAIAQAPAVVSNLVLANIDARGNDIPKVTAPEHGSFLISMDVPSKAEYTSYLCSLYSSSGALLWQLPVSAQQAENTVAVRVPTDKASAGVNELRVQGVPSAGGAPVDVGRYRFSLQVSP